jgi:hypothetical protein
MARNANKGLTLDQVIATLRANNGNISLTARTLKVTYRPLPTALSADGTSLNCPDVLVQLVTTRAAVFAMADLGESETQFDSAYAVLKDEMLRMYDNPNAEGRSMTPKLVESPGMFF